jgi:ABC-type antimicrobial peptide transport system ATPase subunit
MLYRTWFSHPSVASIVWWNVVDGHAYGKEGELRGGLVNKDLSTKSVYRVLCRLIRDEWRTRASTTTSVDGTATIRAFHGRHRVTVAHAGRSIIAEVATSRDAPGRVTAVV